jgi:hypothetical protein
MHKRWLFVLTLVIAGPAAGQSPTPTTPAWTVRHPFEKADDARRNLSGAACAPAVAGKRRCLVVNDEKRYAQYFIIDGTVIIPEAVTLLRTESGDPDAEGVAFDVTDDVASPGTRRAYFYVTGSHGRSGGGKLKDSVFQVFRIPVNPGDGTPLHPPSEDNNTGIANSDRLRTAIATHPKLKDFASLDPGQNGVNIEGIAARNGQLYFGLRGPTEDGKHPSAFIIKTRADALFADGFMLGPDDVIAVRLGVHTGIRDLAAVSDGLLMVTGPRRDEAGIPYRIQYWREGDEKPIDLHTVDMTGLGQAKLETIVVLEETANAYKLLLIFEDVVDGAPRQVEIAKKPRS